MQEKVDELKYTDFLDYVVALLKYAREKEPNNFISLKGLCRLLAFKGSYGEIQEVARYLESRGWAKVLFVLGDVKIQATTQGILYIEGKDSLFWQRQRSYWLEVTEGKSDDFFLVKSFNEDDDPKNDILNLIDKIIEELKADPHAGDYIKDLQIVRLEVEKVTPDLRLVEIKLNAMVSYSRIASRIQELKDYLTVS